MNAANTYPQLKKIVWIGGSSSSQALISSSFAAGTRFICPTNLYEQGTWYHYVMEYINKEEPDDYSSHITYDIVWSLAKAIDKVGYISAKVKEVLPGVADDWTK